MAPLRRNLLSRTQHLKPLISLWRSQKTKANPSLHVSRETLVDSASTEMSDTDIARPFEDMPGPKTGLKSMVNFYLKTEGLSKVYKVTESLFAEYGPVYKENMTLSGAPTVHIIDPDDFEKVFRAEGKYPRRPPLFDFFSEHHRKRKNYYPSLGTTEGEEWHRLRHNIAPKIMRPKIVEENIDNFNAVTKDAIARFVKLKEACGPDDHIPDLEGELSKWATESIGTLAFDTRLGLYENPPPQEALKFIREVHNFFYLFQKLLFSTPSRVARKYVETPTLKKFFKCNDVIAEIGQGFIDKKTRELTEMAEKGTDSSDNRQIVPLLTYLLTKEGLTPREIVGHMTEVVGAGVDTMSNSVLWWLYNLARFPHVQEKLYQEIESVVGKDEDITSQHLAKLPYLKACLKESMRLTPTTAINARILDQDVVLSGYNVPADTCIMFETYCTASSEKYFKDPLEFKPERWLRENKHEIRAFSNLQFGFGARMCAGRRVAELEMHMFMCKLLQRFRLEYHHEPLESYQKLMMVPDKPVKIKFFDRL